MKRKQYIKIKQIRRPEVFTRQEKEARLYALAEKIGVKIGGMDHGLTERDSKG